MFHESDEIRQIETDAREDAEHDPEIIRLSREWSEENDNQWHEIDTMSHDDFKSLVEELEDQCRQPF